MPSYLLSRESGPCCPCCSCSRILRQTLRLGSDWSGGMRDTLEAFTASGGNAAFFSGNTCCWQVRPEDRVDSGTAGSGETRTEARAFTCWKQWCKLALSPVRNLN